jgi:hypothetical protein
MLRLRLLFPSTVLLFGLLLAVQVPSSEGISLNTDLFNDIPINGTLADGSNITGTISITNLAFRNAQFLVSGEVHYVSPETGLDEVQSFTVIASSLSSNGGNCRVVNLNLQPFHFDELGVLASLSPVDIHVNGQRGIDQIAGNLLCSVAHLLNGGAVSSILDRINDLIP